MVGILYAIPLYFYGIFSSDLPRAKEIFNVYVGTAFLGLSHFIFAYEGQFKALANRATWNTRLVFISLLLLAALALALTRNYLGIRYFSLLAWIYFIPHFLKAETFFEKNEKTDKAQDRKAIIFATFCFAFLTTSLYLPVESATSLVHFIIGVVLGLNGFIELRRSKSTPRPTLYLVGFFILAEALLWSRYRLYMSEIFREGVYVLHIAIASFYHYLRAYEFAATRVENRKRFWVKVLTVNSVVITLGILSLLEFTPAAVQPLFHPIYFTFWVALHLIASDIFQRVMVKA